MKYRYLRYKWLKGHDMDKLQELLSESFSVARRNFPGNDNEFSTFKEDRVELIVTADRLRVHANAHRAFLNQIEEGSFTRHDMELREFFFEHYPDSRPNPLPWSFNFEPKFQVEDEG